MAETVNYREVLADLKARRAQLDQAIAGIEVMLGEASVVGGGGEPIATKFGGSGPTPTIHPDTFFGLGIAEAAKKYLKMVRRAQHTKDIADALGQGGMKRPPENNLFSILVRAAKGREVVKVGKGMWGLTEWYPKPPKEPTEDRRKRPAARKASPAKAASAKNSAPQKKVASKPTRVQRAPEVQTQSTNGARPSDVALEVMRAAGKPLHAAEITKRINERGVETTRLPIEAFLNRQTKAGKMQKVAPSTFALAS